MPMTSLDRLTEQAADEADHRSRGFEGSALAPRATPPQVSGEFRFWNGWGRSIGLNILLEGRARAEFTTRGSHLYRISIPRLSGPAIGMTISNSIETRVRQHATAHPDGERRLRAEILRARRDGVSDADIRVQAGQLRSPLPPRLVHMYEIWLQNNEAVYDWSFIRNTTTFE
jgi:hypothetical protein